MKTALHLKSNFMNPRKKLAIGVAFGLGLLVRAKSGNSPSIKMKSTIYTFNRFFRSFAAVVAAGLFSISVRSVHGGDLIPQPKSVVWRQEVFRLGNDLAIVSGPETLESAADLQRELKAVCGISCAIFPPGDRPKDCRAIVLKVGGLEAKDSTNAEGYTLEVGQAGVSLRSRAAAGVFYGVQTLKQLFQRQGDDLVVPGGAIRDEPALAWRGVYLNLRSGITGPETMESLKRLVDAFAQMKLNVLFFEIADVMQYERQSFPASAKRAFSKQQMRELVTYAKARHFEVIPTFQMLSHAGWVLSNPKNVELLENPKDRGWNTAWCPSNPKVAALVQDILDETIEVFQPRYCHVGLDEVNYGPFRECEKCRPEKPAQLFLKSILLLHDALTAKGVKMIMWHDTLLPPGSKYMNQGDKARGWEIVDQVPKDVLIADWDYEVFDDVAKAHLEFFTQKGFSVVGASFCIPKGIQTFAAGLAQNPKSIGLFSTHWYQAGIWSQPRTMAPQAWFEQVLEAQYAWNPTNPPLPEIRYDPVHVMRQMLGPKESLAERGAWESVSLGNVFNGRISDEKGSWPGYGVSNSLIQVFAKDIVCGDVTFRTAGEAVSRNVLLLKGDKMDGLTGEPVTIPVQRKTKRVAFLHACNIPLNVDELTAYSHACNMPPVGKYQIHYDDGTSSEMELRYRWNIMDWNDKMGAFEGRVAFAGKTKEGFRIELIRTDWVNPSPEKTIRSITVSTAANQGMSLALFAISIKN